MSKESRFVPLSERIGSAGVVDSLKQKQHVKTGSSSDERNGPMIQMEDFRCGFPKPLPKPPVRAAAVEDSFRVPVWRDCVQLTVSICRELGLQLREVGIYNLVGKKHTLPAPTIVVIVPDDNQDDLWRSTLIYIFRMLQAQGALDLHAMIRCSNLPEKKFVFAVEANHPLVPVWPKKLLPQVLTMIRSHQLQFSAVEVFHHGTTLEASQPTVFITVKDEDEDQEVWEEMRFRIAQLCQSEGYKLAVELREASGTLTRSEKNSTGEIVNRVYNMTSTMGSSIGVEPKGAGTLGGYLSLKDPKNGAIIVAGLTNYHVVRGSRKDWPAHFDDKFSRWPKKVGFVQSPAQEDHLAEKHEVQTLLSDLETGWDNSTRESYDKQVSEINRYKQRLQFLNSLNINHLLLGKVLFSSGFRLSDATGHALDWALFQIDAGREGENEVSNEHPMNGFQRKVSDFSRQHISDISAVYKMGRTSGMTFGKYSHIESHVEMELWVNDENKKPLKRITSEYVFVPLKRDGEEFSREGDSGSWVVDKSGKLAGLIWGSNALQGSYVTSIADVIVDIEKQTKMEVSLYEGI